MNGLIISKRKAIKISCAYSSVTMRHIENVDAGSKATVLFRKNIGGQLAFLFYSISPEMFLQMEKFQEPVSSVTEVTVVSLLPHLQLALVLCVHVII
jgi:hypothetical protein